jgi:ABC-2 type transport system permease protein
MSKLHILIGREFKALFVSPVLWVVLVMFLFFQGFSFWLLLNFLSQPMAPEGAPMQYFFGGSMLYWLCFHPTCAVIPMGAIAAERRNGTLETLMTAPVTDLEVILSKFLACWGFFGILWVPTLAYVLLLSQYGEIDLGPVCAGYLGTLLLGGAFISIGILTSTATRNQIVAAIAALGIGLFLFLLALLAYLPSTMGSHEDLFNYVSIWSHMDDWGKGIVDTRHAAYPLSIMVLSLFCSVRLLEGRRWR